MTSWSLSTPGAELGTSLIAEEEAGCLEPYSEAQAIPATNDSPDPLCLPVERDRALDYQEPHWKEFHFDLTQIPAGEAVTAAEFRIYKEPSIHLLNMTLHVSMFEVVQEHSNRYLPLPKAPTPPHCLMVKVLWSPGYGRTFPRKGRFLGGQPQSWEKMHGQKVLTLLS
jgi:hypothetical protein